VAAGLPFRIHVEGPRSSHYELVVPEAAAEAALRLLAPVAASHPELDLRPVVSPVSMTEQEVERALAACPACEARLPPGARECPDCGLNLHKEGDEGGN
jgi:hypothetical protein